MVLGPGDVIGVRQHCSWDGASGWNWRRCNNRSQWSKLWGDYSGPFPTHNINAVSVIPSGHNLVGRFTVGSYLCIVVKVEKCSNTVNPYYFIFWHLWFWECWQRTVGSALWKSNVSWEEQNLWKIKKRYTMEYNDGLELWCFLLVVSCSSLLVTDMLQECRAWKWKW